MAMIRLDVFISHSSDSALYRRRTVAVVRRGSRKGRYERVARGTDLVKYARYHNWGVYFYTGSQEADNKRPLIENRTRVNGF